MTAQPINSVAFRSAAMYPARAFRLLDEDSALLRQVELAGLGTT